VGGDGPYLAQSRLELGNGVVRTLELELASLKRWWGSRINGSGRCQRSAAIGPPAHSRCCRR